MRTIIALPMILMAGVANAQQNKPMYLSGAGATSCAEFGEQYKRDAAVEHYYFAWAQGFMSGINLGVEGATHTNRVHDLSAVSATEQELRIRQYCIQRPLSSYVEAVTNLFGTLPVGEVPKVPGAR